MLLRKVTRYNKGFTLIELMVVLSIIGLLSSIVFTSLNSAREKAKVAKAQTEIKQLESAINMLYNETGFYPGMQSLSPCIQNPEIYLNTPEAGVSATDGTFPSWRGPYMSTVPLDPWGTNYYYDPDYACGATTNGCRGSTTAARVVQSFGPNKTQNYGDGDDVVTILCQ